MECESKPSNDTVCAGKCTHNNRESNECARLFKSFTPAELRASRFAHSLLCRMNEYPEIDMCAECKGQEHRHKRISMIHTHTHMGKQAIPDK